MAPEQCPSWDCVTQMCTLTGGDCEPGAWDACFYDSEEDLDKKTGGYVE